MIWDAAQTAELAWWGGCLNTFAEESVQLIAAQKMGLDVRKFTIHTAGTIVDIGGGPVSLLLKSTGFDRGVVVDPAHYPAWTEDRYTAAGIELIRVTGEHFLAHGPTLEPDEVWIYNTLQHVHDPEAIVVGACERAPVVRLFEWVEFETNDAHIHTLQADDIERWGLSVAGTSVKSTTEPIAFAGEESLSYHGVFTRRP